MRRYFRAWFAAATLLAVPLTPVSAEEYPARGIKIVVPSPAGGGSDRMARVLAEKLHAKWGQPVVVENRAGAGGNLGSEYVAKSAPDGYTLLFAAQLNLVIVKSVYSNLGFDPDTLTPVTVVTTSPNVLVVNPKLAAGSLQELIALGKQNPGKLNFGSTGLGSSQQLAFELMKSMAKIDLVHVPYKGTAPALNDLLAGHIEMMFVEISNVLPQISAGKLRALAVGSRERNPALPDVPAVAEALPGFVSMQWTGIVCPPGMPPDIARKLSDAVAEALKQPDIAQALRTQSQQAVGNTPDAMAAFMTQERERWGGIIRATGIKVE